MAKKLVKDELAVRAETVSYTHLIDILPRFSPADTVKILNLPFLRTARKPVFSFH